MRLDKYLKLSHIIKRRTVAKEAAINSKIYVNDKLAKPSTPINIGSIITIKYSDNELRVRVLSTEEHVKKNESSSMYEVIE